MHAGQHLNLLAGQAFDPSILWMGVERDLSLRQPLAQGFGINGESLTTLDERKTGHERASFLSNKDETRGEIEGKVPGLFPLLLGLFPGVHRERRKACCLARLNLPHSAAR